MLPLRREQTIYGRRLYATGGNAEAVQLAGVRIRPLRLAAFGLSGVGAESAGLMLASRLVPANPTQGCGLDARRHRGCLANQCRLAIFELNRYIDALEEKT
jgi:ABC-type xylose transport system permease subunit